MYNISSLMNFSLALSGLDLYVSSTTEFPLCGMDS